MRVMGEVDLVLSGKLHGDGYQLVRVRPPRAAKAGGFPAALLLLVVAGAELVPHNHGRSMALAAEPLGRARLLRFGPPAHASGVPDCRILSRWYAA